MIKNYNLYIKQYYSPLIGAPKVPLNKYNVVFNCFDGKNRLVSAETFLVDITPDNLKVLLKKCNELLSFVKGPVHFETDFLYLHCDSGFLTYSNQSSLLSFMEAKQ